MAFLKKKDKGKKRSIEPSTNRMKGEKTLGHKTMKQ